MGGRSFQCFISTRGSAMACSKALTGPLVGHCGSASLRDCAHHRSLPRITASIEGITVHAVLTESFATESGAERTFVKEAQIEADKEWQRRLLPARSASGRGDVAARILM